MTTPGTVTRLLLTPGQQGVIVPATAVSGVSFASFSNDNTTASGLNSVPVSTVVQAMWQATQDGSTWYQIAGCSLGGGGTASTSSLGVSTMASEQQVRLIMLQPSAVGPGVVIAPTATVS